MSWDLAVMKLDRVMESADEFPPGFVPPPLGSAADVRAAICKTFTTTDWRDPALGVFDGDGFSLEFKAVGEPMVSSLNVRIRGAGHPLAPLMHMCVSSGWQGLDVQTGIFLDLAKFDEASWRRFSEWRDRQGKALNRGLGGPL